MAKELPAASSWCCTGLPNPAEGSNANESLMSGGASDDIVTCQVMVGPPVSRTAAEATSLYRDYEGKRYHFCCAGCVPAFDSDPANYAAAME
jgi:YHS domain-containing protein